MILRIHRFKLDLVFLLIGITPVFYIADRLNPDIEVQQAQYFHAIAYLVLACVHVNRWIGGFLLLAFSHLFIFGDVPILFRDLLYFAAGAAIYHFIVVGYEGRYWRHVLAVVLLANLAISAFQFCSKDVYFFQNQQASGFFTLPSYMGMFAAATGPVLATLTPWLIPFSATAVLLSKSSFSIIAYAVAMGFWLYSKSRPKIWIGLLLVQILALVLYVGFDAKEGQFNRRFEVWKMVASKAFRSPFAGHGGGNYAATKFLEFRGDKNAHFFQINVKPENESVLKEKILAIAKEEGTATDRIEAIHFKFPGGPFFNLKAIMDDLRGKEKHPLHGYDWNHPHNEYLKVFYEYGLIGIILVFGFIWELFKRPPRDLWDFEEVRITHALKSSLIAILILSFAHFPFHTPKLAAVFLFLIAMLERYLARSQNQEEKSL